MAATVPIYMNLIARQLRLTNSYIEFRENPTNYLLTHTRLRIDRRKDVVSTHDTYLYFDKKAKRRPVNAL
jgi:hypothetical protein